MIKDGRAELFCLSFQTRRAVFSQLQGPQTMCCRIVARSSVIEARFGDQSTFRIVNFDFDPRILRIHHAARKTMTDAFIPQSHIHDDVFSGFDRGSVGR